ncbi:TIGR04211 family SH3 domain-containing protein [Marinobacter caseinilyticus]|uniref:TIGR04211 family SH3 domain-containing protein n=1 Tax=Marinobacter caseinilyticus TaxID=2692195 RepID=UPI00140A5F2A|nr:TIGR04211 family SH3 domain-containing protein [Marinobacter caseinilyticus]
MTSFRLIALLILTASAALPVYAETAYIDDTLFAPIRSGEGTQYRILHNGLRSGTPVELLERSESGYSRVRTRDGIEGWIVSRFLSDQPIARDRLVATSKELERTKSQLSEVREQLQGLQSERDQLASSEQTLESRSETLARELEKVKTISANALTLDRRNRELQEANQKLRNDVEVLTAERERLESNSERDFMLLSAGLVLLGVFLAVVVPWMKPTRKNDNWA